MAVESPAGFNAWKQWSGARSDGRPPRSATAALSLDASDVSLRSPKERSVRVLWAWHGTFSANTSNAVKAALRAVWRSDSICTPPPALDVNVSQDDNRRSERRHVLESHRFVR